MSRFYLILLALTACIQFSPGEFKKKNSLPLDFDYEDPSVASVTSFFTCGSFHLCGSFPDTDLSKNEQFTDIASASDGTLFLVGQTNSSIVEEANPSQSGYHDLFVLRISAGDNYLIKNYGDRSLKGSIGDGNESINSAAVSSDDSQLFVAGSSLASNLTPGNTNSQTTYATIFITSSNLIMKKIVQLTPASTGNGVSGICRKVLATADGGALCAGYMSASYFGSSFSGSSVFLWKITSTGATAWVKPFDKTFMNVFDVALSSDGNIVFAGAAKAAVSEPLAGPSNSVPRNAYVAKFQSSTGNLLWERQWGLTTFPSFPASGATALEEVRTDGAGNIYVHGFVQGVSLFESMRFFSDRVIAKYDSSGTMLWGTQFGTTTFPSGTYPGPFFFFNGFRLQGDLRFVLRETDGSTDTFTDLFIDPTTGALSSSPSTFSSSGFWTSGGTLKWVNNSFYLLRSTTTSFFGPFGGETDAVMVPNP